jgi:hypothetical protein
MLSSFQLHLTMSPHHTTSHERNGRHNKVACANDEENSRCFEKGGENGSFCHLILSEMFLSIASGSILRPSRKEATV